MTTIAISPVDAPRSELSTLAKVAVGLFIWLLPFHSLIIATLFGLEGFSAGSARTIAAWKETAIVVLVLWVALRAASGRGAKTHITAPDVGVGALITIAAVFLFAQNPLFRAGIPAGAELYAFRDGVFFMFLYYVGRASPEIANSETVMRNAVAVTLIVSLIGIIERLFVSPEMLVLLGVASYQSDFLGLAAYTTGNEYGLPLNYWTWIGGVPVRRAGSVFLHSQGFALPFLLLMPLVTVWAFSRQRKHQILVRIAYLVAWAGLMVTITRMTVLVCLAQVALLFVVMRRPQRVVTIAALSFAAVLLTMVVVPGVLKFAWETLAFQTASSESHVRDWAAGALAFFEKPWGNGLGTTDAPPVRFLRPAITSDNMYLSYAVQMGVAGIVCLLAPLIAFVLRGWRVAWRAPTDPQRRFGAVMFVAAVGILANGATSTVFSSNVLAYLFFWQAGALVTLSESVV